MHTIPWVHICTFTYLREGTCPGKPAHAWKMILQRQDLKLNSFLVLLPEQTLQDYIAGSHIARNTCWYFSWSGVTFLKIAPFQQKNPQIPEQNKKIELNYIRDIDEIYSISSDNVVEVEIRVP